MMDGIRKFGRALRRDHLPLISPVPVIAGMSSSVGSMIAKGTVAAANVFASVFTLALLSTFFWAVKYVPLRKKTVMRMDMREINGMVYGLDLLGPGTKMHTVASTQKLIDKLTKKYRTAAQLPAKLQKRIDAHIGDAAVAAQKVRASVGGEEVREVEFLRTTFNAMGQMQEVPVGKIAVLHTETPDEIDAKAKAEAAAKIAEGAQAASAIHTGSTKTLTVKTIKLKQPRHGRRTP